MHYRRIGQITRDHIQEHLPTYLDEASADLDGTLKLPPPKTFDLASFVGGVAGVGGRNDFPALAIDAHTKTPSTTNEGLYVARYDGQITWMVGGDNAKVVEQQAKGYGGALERFFDQHAYHPFATAFDESTLPFSFIECAWLRTEFFGAANVEVEQKGRQKLWIDGGRMEIAWLISENGNGQHDA